MMRVLVWAPVLAMGALLLTLARPVRLQGDAPGSGTVLWLWAWQHGSVRFTNSVTGGPVNITFGLLDGFDHFRMRTDEKTEDYYTGGTYRINDRLGRQRTRSLAYCTVVGMTVTLGGRRFELADDCLEIQLLWPPF
ncbi:MAG: hypothetical protein P8Z81_05350 [Deinococcales bacterium]